MPELVERCCSMGRAQGVPFEVLLVDDGSTDGTADAIVRIGAPEVTVVRMPRNGGQFRAVKEGMSRAAGDHVAVLDGDLQDPPELVAAMLERARGSAKRPSEIAIFAVKSSRREALPFRAAQAVFHRAQSALARTPMPRGASSYCLLGAPLARRVARVALPAGNVAAVVAALGVRGEAIEYDKAARRDGPSRLGFVRHVEEGVASLALTGALSRLAWMGVAVAIAGALASIAIAGPTPNGIGGACAALAAGLGLAMGARAIDARVAAAIGDEAIGAEADEPLGSRA